jgi:putative ABC transport system permease protein
MRKKDLGFNKDQVITVPLQDKDNVQTDHLLEKIKAIPGIISVSASANEPGGSDWGIPYEAIGLPKEQQPAMRCLVVDENFLSTYNIQIASGRGFSKDFATDTSAYLINETAARQLGWTDPSGQQLSMPAISRGAGPIIGVVKDFHYHSLHEKIEPLYIFMKKEWFSHLNIKIDKAAIQPSLASLKNLWGQVEPQFPFRYNFLDERFENFYESEKKMVQLLLWFTVIAIIISSLGLYALSTLIAKQRIREIGIRKVLGASVTSLVALLSKDFLTLVLIALVIAVPIAWLCMNEWLKDFAYRINIEWWLFALAGIIAMLIAFFTISFQSIKAAISNPVRSLRTE